MTLLLSILFMAVLLTLMAWILHITRYKKRNGACCSATMSCYEQQVALLECQHKDTPNCPHVEIPK